MLIAVNLWRAAALALLALCLVLLIRIHGLPLIGGGLIADLDHMTALNASNVANHRQTKATYREAQADAVRREVFRLARVRAEHQRNNDHAKDDFNRRLADLRARYDSLRGQVGKAAGSAGNSQSVPGLSDAARRTDAAPGADGLPSTEMTLAERYEASVIATQLDELISWVERQSQVKVND